MQKREFGFDSHLQHFHRHCKLAVVLYNALIRVVLGLKRDPVLRPTTTIERRRPNICANPVRRVERRVSADQKNDCQLPGDDNQRMSNTD